MTVAAEAEAVRRHASKPAGHAAGTGREEEEEIVRERVGLIVREAAGVIARERSQ